MSETAFAAGYTPPAEPAAEPVAEPAAEPWSGPSQDEWGSVMGYIQQQQAAQQAWEAEQFQQQQGAPYAGLDPFSETFGNELQGMIGQAVQQAIAPLTEWQYGQQLNEAHDRAFDIIADDVARNGEFMLGETAYNAVEALANAYMPEFAQKFGYGPQAAEAALARAGKEWREYESKIAEAGVQRHMNQLSTLGGVPREPVGVQPAASSGYRSRPGGDELSVVSDFGGFPGRPTG